MDDVSLIVSGCLAVLAAGVHGGAGEVLVVRKLSLAGLPETPLGSAQFTKAMIRAAWHLTTFAFLAVGCALILSGTVLDGDVARGTARLAAVTTVGFAAIIVVLAVANAGTLRAIYSHPGPGLLTLTAALACWGAF